MNQPIDHRLVFSSAGLSTMDDVLARVRAEMTGTRRRDTVSAFNSAAKVLGIDWNRVPATPPTLRDLLGQRCAAELGISERRRANICSLIRKAFEAFGEFEPHVTKRVPMNRPWYALLESVPKAKKHWRAGLNHLACFCSATNVPPNQVCKDVLLDFFEALEHGELVRDPRRKLKHTIACWNMCHRNVPGWPDIRLRSPFDSKAFRVPLEEFPASFQEDIARWRDRCLNPDFMDDDAAPRRLKPITVDSQIARIVRFASALVIKNELAIEEIIDLGVLVADVNRIKAGLRFFLERNGGKPNASVAQIAAILRAIAKHHVKVPTEVQEKIDRLAAAVRVVRESTLTPKNRQRLRQFDDPKNIQKLFAYPANEAQRGRTLSNPHRRAKCFERAVAVELLIATSMRAFNIRTVRISDFQWVDFVCYLAIPGDRVKNGENLDYQLAPNTAKLITEFIRDFRPDLPGSHGDYLFPGRDGGPRPHNSLFDGLFENLRKRTGLIMNAHHFRHTMCKIIVAAEPGMELAMSRHLGHKRINTTMQHYLGTEGRAISRRIDTIVDGIRNTGRDRRGKDVSGR